MTIKIKRVRDLKIGDIVRVRSDKFDEVNYIEPRDNDQFYVGFIHCWSILDRSEVVDVIDCDDIMGAL